MSILPMKKVQWLVLFLLAVVPCVTVSANADGNDTEANTDGAITPDVRRRAAVNHLLDQPESIDNTPVQYATPEEGAPNNGTPNSNSENKPMKTTHPKPSAI